MEYFVKKSLIKAEFKKLSTGHFHRDNPRDVNRARFLAEIKEAYLKTQLRGMGYGLTLSLLTVSKLSFRESIVFRLFMMYATKEFLLFNHVDDFYECLEVQKYNVNTNSDFTSEQTNLRTQSNT